MTCLVFGGLGQMGSHLKPLLPNAQFLSRKEADFLHPQSVTEALTSAKPSFVINLAAWTDVPGAEKNPKDAELVNAASPHAIALYTAKQKIPFIHISTDFVFSGPRDKPWNESDTPSPANQYGLSKLKGEMAIVAADGSSIILRTAWVYDRSHNNFFTKVLKNAETQSELVGVTNEVGSPTYVPHFVKTVVQIYNQWKKFNIQSPRIYHLTHQGMTSRFEWATSIVKGAFEQGLIKKAPNVRPVLSESLPSIVQRPQYSVLNCQRIREELGIELPDWNNGLKDCLKA